MNIILLHREDFINCSRVVLRGRRSVHIKTVHRAVIGDSLEVGLVDGKLGVGVIVDMSDDSVELSIDLNTDAPEPLPITMILALPRPKMLKRILINAVSMGVKRIVLLNSYRVEKSFWLSPVLQPEGLNELIALGLEQGKDTVLPQIYLKKRFKPFVEDELPALVAGTKCLVAHPYDAKLCPVNVSGPLTIAIGPEGGFIPYEVERLIEAGFGAVHLGQRILRVEAAVPAIIGRLMTH